MCTANFVIVQIVSVTFHIQNSELYTLFLFNK